MQVVGCKHHNQGYLHINNYRLHVFKQICDSFSKGSWQPAQMYSSLSAH